METQADFIFLGSKITWKVTAAIKLKLVLFKKWKDTCSLEEKFKKRKKKKKAYSALYMSEWEAESDIFLFKSKGRNS